MSDEIYEEYSKRLTGCTISEEQKIKISKTLTGRKCTKEAIENRARSCRKFGDKEESQMMDLFNYGFTIKDISLMFETKITTVHSIRARYRNEKSSINGNL